MFNINSPFFRFITSIGNIIIVSILWLIGCLPIVTIATSTSALYYTCVKSIRHDRGYVINNFFHSYKSNLKQGIVLSTISLIVAFILSIDYQYITSLNPAPAYLIIIYRIAFFFFICMLIYLITNLSRFQLSFLGLLKLSLFMMIRHFYLTFVMVVIFITFGILLLSIPISILFLPGVCMLLISLSMENIFKKYTNKAENYSMKDWYFEE